MFKFVSCDCLYVYETEHIIKEQISTGLSYRRINIFHHSELNLLLDVLLQVRGQFNICLYCYSC